MHKHIHAGAHEQCIRIRHAPVWSGWDACVLQVWAQVCAKAVLSLCHILSWWGRRQRLCLRSAVYAQQSCLVLATLTINIGLVDVCEGKQLHFYCALLISDIPTHSGAERKQLAMDVFSQFITVDVTCKQSNVSQCVNIYYHLFTACLCFYECSFTSAFWQTLDILLYSDKAKVSSHKVHMQDEKKRRKKSRSQAEGVFIITPNLVRSTDAKSVQELYLDFSNKEDFLLVLWSCKTTIWLVMKTPNENDPLFIASPYYSGHRLCWGNHGFNHYKNDFKSSLCGHRWVQGSKGDIHLFFSWHVSWTSAVNVTVPFLNFAPTGHKNVNIPTQPAALPQTHSPSKGGKSSSLQVDKGLTCYTSLFTPGQEAEDAGNMFDRGPREMFGTT